MLVLSCLSQWCVRLPSLPRGMHVSSYHDVSSHCCKWLLYLYKCLRDSFRQLWEDKSTTHGQNTISILFTPFVY